MKFSLALALGLAALVASSEARATEVYVRRIQGAAGRALRRALVPTRFGECQRTWMGGSVWLSVRVSRGGAFTVVRAQYAGEEIASYVGCVRRVVERARSGALDAETDATIEVRFAPLGLAPGR
jgi:hypothetical protein